MATLYGLVGFAAGLYMGISSNGALTSAHAHLGLLGWLSFGVYSYFYHLYPRAGETKLAAVHYWLANIGLVIMVVSVAMLHSGHPSAGPGAGIGSILTLLAFVLFTVIVFTRTNWPGKH